MAGGCGPDRINFFANLLVLVLVFKLYNLHDHDHDRETMHVRYDYLDSHRARGMPQIDIPRTQTQRLLYIVHMHASGYKLYMIQTVCGQFFGR